MRRPDSEARRGRRLLPCNRRATKLPGMDRPEPLTNFWCEVLDFPARGDATGEILEGDREVCVEVCGFASVREKRKTEREFRNALKLDRTNRPTDRRGVPS